MSGGGDDVMLHGVVREAISDEVTFEQRPDGSEFLVVWELSKERFQ